MQKVSELVSKSVGDTLTNIKTWGPLMYNALEHGVKGDWDGVKGTDDTEAMQELVNKAIAEGRKCIGLPHTPTGGMYYVTHLDDADQVVFVGDNASFVGGFTGTINQLGISGVPQQDFDELKAETAPMLDTTDLVSTLNSFFGFVNKAYLADNGTRIYLLPRAAVTSGVGGVLKIFGDPYHLDSSTYRDLGVYFHQNQLGDTGYNGQGCFFINVKVAGAAYANKHPDIVFSFQDGAQSAGRFVRLANEKGTYTCFIIGAGNVEMADLDGVIRAELHGSMGIRNNHGLKWLDTSGNLTGIVIYDNNNRMVQKAVAGFEQHINSVKVVESNGNSTKYNHAVVHTPKTVITDNFDTTPNVAATNRIQFNQSSATTITNFVNGTDGQQLRILFSNGNTKLQHGTNIRLAGGVDYTGAQHDTLTLELWGTTWYEMSRSQNHA